MSNKTNEGGKPAFPSAIWVDVDNHFENPGMSLREYYAGLCLQGILTGIHSDDKQFMDNVKAAAAKPEQSLAQHVARMSIEYADALITELNKQP